MINRILFLLVFAVIVSTAYASDGGKKESKVADTGIQFTSGKWADILKKAKAENKIIFFDAYTTWCGPCKLMQKNVFTRADVGEVFNKNFINVKVDMESGEGPMLAKKYPLEGYPTLFFIDSDGKLIKEHLGAPTAETLIKIGKNLAKDKAAL